MQKKQHGFTLVEALVSTLILSGASAAMLTAQLATLSQQAKSGGSDFAIHAVMDMSERLRAGAEHADEYTGAYFAGNGHCNSSSNRVDYNTCQWSNQFFGKYSPLHRGVIEAVVVDTLENDDGTSENVTQYRIAVFIKAGKTAFSAYIIP